MTLSEAQTRLQKAMTAMSSRRTLKGQGRTSNCRFGMVDSLSLWSPLGRPCVGANPTRGGCPPWTQISYFAYKRAGPWGLLFLRYASCGDCRLNGTAAPKHPLCRSHAARPEPGVQAVVSHL